MNEIVIVGGGPTGLSLALNLANSKNKITLIEKSDLLGGSWKSRLLEGKYFSEHSPQVLFSNYIYFHKLLEFLKIDKNKYIVEPYGNIFKFYIKMIKFFFKNFSISDFIKFFMYVLYTEIFGSKLTIQEMMDKLNFSKSGRKAITMLSLAAADIPSKVMFENLDVTQSTYLVQMHDKNYFINKMEKVLLDNNVRIIKNAEVVKINGDRKVESVEIKKAKKRMIIKGDQFIIATPPINLYYLLKQSPSFSDNWKPINKLKKWAHQSTYYSIGFQLHFDKEIKWKTEWGWSIYSDWYIIILPISDFITEFTKDRRVKTVWSCTIIEGGFKSSRTNKTVHQSTKDEIIDEALYQISKEYGKKLNPIKITFNKTVKKINNKWVSDISGVTIGKLGTLSFKGKVKNLYSVGCHNLSVISNLDNALKSSIIFIKKHYPNIKIKTDISNNKNFIIFLIILIIFYLKYYNIKLPK